MVRRRALITGISGQDGRELARFLLAKDYDVVGLSLTSEEVEGVKIIQCDIRETEQVAKILDSFRPDELYNLAAISNVAECEADRDLAFGVNYTAWSDILGLICRVDPGRSMRIFQASTSEMFGNAAVSPQTEETPVASRNIYGETKVEAHQATVRYRKDYGLRASCGILFNHEGPNRGLNFVTRKITHGAAVLKAGGKGPLELGNLDAARDWGHVRDFVNGMWLMLQADVPDDFVLATGKAHTVRQFIEIAFAAAGLPLDWEGEGVYERGRCRASGRSLVVVNPEFVRPGSDVLIVGDAAKAREKLGWTSRTNFEALIEEMVAADFAALGDHID
jgi:GDPmannose 4,6-dehydratase